MRATNRCTGQRHMSAKALTRASPEYRSSLLGLKVKAVDKPGIIPARNRAEHLEVHYKAGEECSIRCGELQSFETTRRSAPGATIP